MECDTNPQTALVRSGPVDNQDEVQFQSTSQNRENAHNLTSPVGGYEEFFGGTIPCPSCRGAGRIPRGGKSFIKLLIFHYRSRPLDSICHTLDYYVTVFANVKAT